MDLVQGRLTEINISISTLSGWVNMDKHIEELQFKGDMQMLGEEMWAVVNSAMIDFDKEIQGLKATVVYMDDELQACRDEIEAYKVRIDAHE